MIISLRKYLDAVTPAPRVEAPKPALSAGVLELVDRVLWAVGEYAFHDDRYQEFRNEMQDHRLAVKKAGSIERIRKAAEGVENLLEAYRRSESWFQMTQAAEMQKILAMLNDTLVALSTGSDRSISRLRQIDTALNRAHGITDIVALKATVAETMRFVRTEMHRERETTTKLLASTEEEFRRVRKALAASSGVFPGRKEAARILSGALRGGSRDRCFVAVFVVERYAALAARFGDELANNILHGFLRERLGPLAAAGGVFLWAPGCVVLVLERDGTLPEVRAEVAGVADAAYEYRVYMSDRVVPVALASRWMLCQGSDWDTESLLGEIDSFAGPPGKTAAGTSAAWGARPG